LVKVGADDLLHLGGLPEPHLYGSHRLADGAQSRKATAPLVNEHLGATVDALGISRAKC
jgi:hypothetical protein